METDRKEIELACFDLWTWVIEVMLPTVLAFFIGLSPGFMFVTSTLRNWSVGSIFTSGTKHLFHKDDLCQQIVCLSVDPDVSRPEKTNVKKPKNLLAV